MSFLGQDAWPNECDDDLRNSRLLGTVRTGAIELSVRSEAKNLFLHYLGPTSGVFRWPTKLPIRVLKEGTKLFHWNNKGTIDTFVRAGRYSNSDFDAFRKLKGSGRHGDWGFYMSEDILDSKGYGDRLYVSTLLQDIWMVDPVGTKDFSHEQLLDLVEVVGIAHLRVLGIVGCMQSNNHSGQSWMFAIDERATTSLREGEVGDFFSDGGLGRKSRSTHDFDVVMKLYPFSPTNPWLVTHYPQVSEALAARYASRPE